MKRGSEPKGESKRKRRRRRRESSMSLGRLLTVFIVAILINAGLMTSSSYIIMNRMGIMEPLRRSTYWPLLLVLLCIVFAIVLALGFGRRQIRPIHRVIRAMKEVSRGDFSIRVSEENAVGDMRELVSSYNNMAEELSGIEMFRTDFINNFSHEFKTPIVSIRGFAKQLEREDITEEQRREYTRIIVRESERLSNMSSNVLLLTRLENQQIITDKEKYALDEQLRSCIVLMEKQWSDRELELRLELDPLVYEGNEEMMRHVWLNLLSNAIKFSPTGGELAVSCMRVQNYIVVQVSDTGVGMDEVTQLRLFEKFYQGDPAHAAEGNGLGLPLVKRIVDLCGGKIAVQSAPGQGTTFSVYLPVEEVE